MGTHLANPRAELAVAMGTMEATSRVQVESLLLVKTEYNLVTIRRALPELARGMIGATTLASPELAQLGTLAV